MNSRALFRSFTRPVRISHAAMTVALRPWPWIQPWVPPTPTPWTWTASGNTTTFVNVEVPADTDTTLAWVGEHYVAGDVSGTVYQFDNGQQMVVS